MKSRAPTHRFPSSSASPGKPRRTPREFVDNDAKFDLYIDTIPGTRGVAGVAITLNGTPPHALVIMVPGDSGDAEGNFPRIVNLDSYATRTVRKSGKPAYAVLRAVFCETAQSEKSIVL